MLLNGSRDQITRQVAARLREEDQLNDGTEEKRTQTIGACRADKGIVIRKFFRTRARNVNTAERKRRWKDEKDQEDEYGDRATAGTA